MGGTQGVAVLRPALPWAEIPLPLQGAASPKPLKQSILYAVQQGAEGPKPLKQSILYATQQGAEGPKPLKQSILYATQ